MSVTAPQLGSIVTFYSWKGGVGRTMALANVAVQLTRIGHRVLMVDWDLEAPGLDRYFTSGEAASSLKVTPPKNDTGLVGLLHEAYLNPSSEPIPRDWKKRLHHIYVPATTPSDSPIATPLHLLGSGLGSGYYGERVSKFSWDSFFADSNGGVWLESIRDQWKKEYDFVLIDSRTGLTDAGGVCTVQMPDILILVFTASEQSLGDGLRLVKSVQTSRRDFAYDRPPLTAVPLLSRWDGDDEVDLGVKWLERMNQDLKCITSAWLPSEFTPRQFLEKVRVPHVARFSFGEPLPVITHSLADANLPGLAYENLARLLDTHLSAAGKIIDPSYNPARYASKLSNASDFDPIYLAARINTPREPIRHFSEAGLNAKFNFDSFVAGPNSSYSLAVARAVAEKPGRIYNPLFFHSPTGLGKTHLMQAIGQEVLARKPRALVRYVTSEQFTNEFAESIKKQTFSQFHQKYRKVDVLLIDDVHFFDGKDSAQEELFHTFNELFNNAKQIVLASDRPPSEIKNLESRLGSRFEWGLATQIQVPDFETRIAILRRKQNDFNVSLDPWILDFMAQRIRANVRKLEGALMRVAAHVSLEGAVTSESALATLLHDVINEDDSKTITADKVQRVVATHYDLRVSDLTGPRRPKNIQEARQVAMFLTRTLTELPLVQIGDEFGGRDHGTVIHACKVITNLVDGSADFKRMVDNLARKVVED